MLLMWTTRLGFVGAALLAVLLLLLEGELSQREMASCVARIGWVRLMSSVA